jgi:hypothetical protein
MRQVATASITALAVLVTTRIAMPAQAQGRLFESRVILTTPADALVTTITLPAVEQARLRFLAVDANGLQQIQRDAVIYINGQKLTGPFIPGLSLVGNLNGFEAFNLHQVYLECGYIFNCLSSPSNISNVDLRQWFLIPLPKDVIESALKKGSMQIEIKLSGSTPVTIFAQHAFRKQVSMPSLNRCSWEKAFYGVENADGFSDPRYDYRLDSQAKDGTLIPDILLLADTGSKDSATAIPAVVKQETMTSLTVCSSSVPRYDKNSFWIIRFAGHITAAGLSSATQATVSTTIESQSLPLQPVALSMASREWAGNGEAYASSKVAQTFSYSPPWMPRSLTLDHNGNSFDISFPLIPSAMPGNVKAINLSINADSVPLKLSDCKMEIYSLPSSPLNPQLHIYIP